MSINDQLTHTDQSDVILKIGEYLYLNEKTADFHFKFEIDYGKYQRIPAHKLLLNSASDIFRIMFNGSWEEKTKDEVEIKDAKVDEFKEFLQFFYLEKVKISMDNVAKVMYLGNKYNITRCMNVCEQFIINTLKVDNACWAYELALVYDQENLKKYCETFIGINTKAVLSSNQFLECNSKNLGQILKLDSLSCPENEVFEACMNWVKTNAQVDQLTRELVQAQLGELFYEVRFKSMTPQEFARLCPSYGRLFSVDEHMDISQAVSLPEFQPNLFSNKIRTSFDTFKWNHEDTLICNRSLSKYLSSKPYSIQSVEQTTFSTNTPLILFNIVYPLIYKNVGGVLLHTEELPTEFTIIQIPDSEQSGEEIVLFSGKNNLRSKTATITILSKPLLIMPGFKYKIKMTQSPPENCCTASLFKREVKVVSNTSINIRVKFHSDSVYEDDYYLARGMISKLGFIPIY